MNDISDRRYQNQSLSPLVGEGRGCQRLRGDRHRESGFTLIELMITVAIIAILAAIAYPSYTQYVRRAHRADAKTALLSNAQFLERNYTESNLYHKTPTNADVTLPYDQSPSQGTAIYNITIDAAPNPDTSYTLTATPVGGGPMAGDACGALTFNNLGVKGVGGSTVAECWGK